MCTGARDAARDACPTRVSGTSAGGARPRRGRRREAVGSRTGCRRRADGRALPDGAPAGCEVARVGRDVGARGEAVAAAAAHAGVVAAAEELDGVGDDLDGLALVALLVLPLAPLEAAVDRDRAALGQEAGAVLALRAPDRDVEVVGLVLPLAGRLSLRRVLHAIRSEQTECRCGSERSSGSRVRLPVRTTRLMLVAATMGSFRGCSKLGRRV